MNVKSRSISISEYTEIVETIANGYCDARPNIRVATVLVAVASTGAKLKSVLTITGECVKKNHEFITLFIEGKEYSLHEFESSIFSQYLSKYSVRNREDKLFTISARCVEKVLRQACSYIGFENIGVKSFKLLSDNINNYEALLGEKQEKSQNNIRITNNLAIPGVYSIRCKKNGRLYIGESEDIQSRWEQHIRDLKNGTHCSNLLQGDFDLFGISGFEFGVLGTYRLKKDRLAMESTFISALGTVQFGYNTRA